MTNRGKAVFALSVLFAINTMNFFDRQVLGAVVAGPPPEPGWGEEAPGLMGPHVAHGHPSLPGQLIDGHAPAERSSKTVSGMTNPGNSTVPRGNIGSPPDATRRA